MPENIRVIAGCWIAITIASATVGCGNVNVVLEQVVEARRLSADLLVQFTKAADAANRAVMADTDDASVAFAHEAGQGMEAAEKDTKELGPLLQSLGYSDEAHLLAEFDARFARYRALDATILQLAVENTNLKAQRLSFGPAQEAADAFGAALQAVAPSASADAWRVKALVATAIAGVREIQALQAPHIAESNDMPMTLLEKRMVTAEGVARGAIETLSTLVRPASRSQLATATAALDRFAGLNTQVIALSHRNTNVRSLALSLDQKRTLTASCEESLHALQAALAKRGFTGTRR